MNGPHVNETPEHLEPTNAVIGEFASATVDEVTEPLGKQGIEPGRISFLHGPEGLQAYEARGSRLARLFDENEDEIAGALRKGMLIVSVHCDDEGDARAVRGQLVELGAVTTHHFGKWTFD